MASLMILKAAGQLLAMAVASGSHLGRKPYNQSLTIQQIWEHSNPLILTSASEDEWSNK